MPKLVPLAIYRLLGRRRMKAAVLLIIIVIGCFEVLSKSSKSLFIDSSSRSIAAWQNYVFSFGVSDVMVANETSSNGADADQTVFPPKNVTWSDGVRSRLISQLKTMTEYGMKSVTVNRTAKVILRLGEFNMEEWIDGQQRFIEYKCPVKECILTSDYDNKSLTADALLITEVDSNSIKKYLPKPPHQIWIVRHQESPLHNRIDPSVLRGLVNWTFTYRSDSTVSAQYFPQLLPTSSNVDPRYHFREDPYYMRTPPPGASHSTINYAQGKSKKVAWFVSNCDGPNGRGAYVAELEKYISVDIYGECGKHSCIKEENGCRRMLSTDYKFYLAFENSNCVEYITEKPGFQALLSDVIPIVMGARPEDYEALLPPDSYIHVDDFQSPKHLAEYLHILDKNNTLYNSYFRWKDSWIPVHDSFWCRLCFTLHFRNDVNYTNWYEDYSDWWNGACSARDSDYGPWKTWRPAGFWNTMNVTSVHKPPIV